MNDLYFTAKSKKGSQGRKLSEQAYIFDKKSIKMGKTFSPADTPLAITIFRIVSYVISFSHNPNIKLFLCRIYYITKFDYVQYIFKVQFKNRATHDISQVALKYFNQKHTQILR